jgi:hypothetical protein
MDELDMKEKLIELFEQEHERCQNTLCNECKYDNSDDCGINAIVDHLIANGVTIRRIREAFGYKVELLDDEEKVNILNIIQHGQAVEWDCPEDFADFLIANGVRYQRWIPVTERLPENDGKFLGVVNEEGYNRIAFVYYSDRRWWDCFYNGFVNVKLTHWMPIPNMPEPPKGECS